MTSPTEMPPSIQQQAVEDLCENRFRINEQNPQFKTLKAAVPFACGELLIDLVHAEVCAAPSYATIDLHDRHVIHPVGRYINHSCDPSAHIDLALQAVVALRALQPGDEITFDYLSTERQIVAPFDCLCGSAKCVRRVEKIEELA